MKKFYRVVWTRVSTFNCNTVILADSEEDAIKRIKCRGSYMADSMDEIDCENSDFEAELDEK